MIIHKGKIYTITIEGNEATKSNGKDIRTMRYYPERDASAIAGEIDELSAWQLLHDIASQIPSNLKTPVSPQHILIDGANFILSEWSEGNDERFTAPEGYEPVWALGASVFYIFLGCHVFQGLGGNGQTSSAPIPTLRRELPELSKIISRCLSHNPSERPSLKEIQDVSGQNISRCKREKQEFPSLKTTGDLIVPANEIDQLWPEEMY